MYNIEIFKAYDIRGIYPSDFDEDFAYRIGMAYPDFIKENDKKMGKTLEIVVNRDARSSSEILNKALIEGLTDAGCYVIDAGLSTSPMHYFAINNANADGGIMVTASHNPAKYNGFKLSKREAIPIGSGSGMEEIKSLIFKKNFSEKAPQKGEVIKKYFLKEYVDYVTRGIDLKGKKMKIAVDCGNGMAGMVVNEIASRYPDLTILPLYFEADCTFPNHEANPLKEETLEELKKLIVKEHADLGVAFDGDGDRVFFLNGDAKVLKSEHSASIYTKDYLSRHSGSKMVTGPRESKIYSDTIRENGGEIVVSRVGHAFIKRILKDGGAAFAAEASGHYYFKEFFGVDSGIFMMMQMLRILAESGKTLKEIAAPFESKYFHSGEINFEVKDKTGKMKQLEEKYSKLKTSKIDGLTAEDTNWWFNVRASNTEPLLRLNIEANSKDMLHEKVRELVDFISE
jgi:phosphomannomutase